VNNSLRIEVPELIINTIRKVREKAILPRAISTLIFCPAWFLVLKMKMISDKKMNNPAIIATVMIYRTTF
jgi:hypothetical protein